MGVVRSCDPLKNFEGSNHITVTAKPKVVKFCTHVGYVSSSNRMAYHPPKGRGYSHVTVFKFCRLSWCSASRGFFSYLLRYVSPSLESPCSYVNECSLMQLQPRLALKWARLSYIPEARSAVDATRVTIFTATAVLLCFIPDDDKCSLMRLLSLEKKSWKPFMPLLPYKTDYSRKPVKYNIIIIVHVIVHAPPRLAVDL